MPTLATTTPSEATPVVPSSQFQPPLLPSNPQPCMTAIPLVVTTDNRTTSKGDLCAAFNRVLGSRSSASLRNNMALGAGMFELHVRLLRLGSGKSTSCNLMVEVLSGSVALGLVGGSARVDAADKFAARDCVDAVLEDMMTRKVDPLMQQQLANLASGNTGSSLVPPAPGNAGSSTVTPAPARPSP